MNRIFANRATINTVFVVFISFFILGTIQVSAQNPVLGPGVMTTIPPCIEYDETFSRHDIIELLNSRAGKPSEFADKAVLNPEIWAKDVRFNHEVYCLEFKFKLPRVITVELPGPDGKPVQKQVWYMIYSVTNTGAGLTSEIDTPFEFPEQTTVTIKACECEFCAKNGAVAKEQVIEFNKSPVLNNQEGSFKPGKFTPKPIKFAPRFILASDSVIKAKERIVDPKDGAVETVVERENVLYYDQVIPLAIEPITKRENLNVKLNTSVSISRNDIKPNETVWGVATWADVNPKINFFSIIVRGLTNAYKVENNDNGKGRVIIPKSLMLNFRRLGDEFEVNDKQFRYGGVPGELDYSWGYY
ncbi:MAG: hypothetical protein ACRC2T_18750 [Thermoguttaceae bacterium]